MENSYRATTIAFMEEWGRFAEAVGVDLFEVVDAIRMRPTHANMRQPGFGVGGYCLTKDPLFAGLAARELFGRPDGLPVLGAAVRINDLMPLVTLDRVRPHARRRWPAAGCCCSASATAQDVADTRYSPSETFVAAATARGAEVVCHDPLVDDWERARSRPVAGASGPRGLRRRRVRGAARRVPRDRPAGWLGDARPIVLDANQRAARPPSVATLAGLRLPCLVHRSRGRSRVRHAS